MYFPPIFEFYLRIFAHIMMIRKYLHLKGNQSYFKLLKILDFHFMVFHFNFSFTGQLCLDTSKKIIFHLMEAQQLIFRVLH